MKISDIRPEVYALAEETETRLRSEFDQIDLIARINTQKVMEAFQDNRVSEACFAGTTGYGYEARMRSRLRFSHWSVRAIRSLPLRAFRTTRFAARSASAVSTTAH